MKIPDDRRLRLALVDPDRSKDVASVHDGERRSIGRGRPANLDGLPHRVDRFREHVGPCGDLDLVACRRSLDRFLDRRILGRDQKDIPVDDVDEGERGCDRGNQESDQLHLGSLERQGGKAWPSKSSPAEGVHKSESGLSIDSIPRLGVRLACTPENGPGCRIGPVDARGRPSRRRRHRWSSSRMFIGQAKSSDPHPRETEPWRTRT